MQREAKDVNRTCRNEQEFRIVYWKSRSSKEFNLDYQFSISDDRHSIKTQKKEIKIIQKELLISDFFEYGLETIL